MNTSVRFARFELANVTGWLEELDAPAYDEDDEMEALLGEVDAALEPCTRGEVAGGAELRRVWDREDTAWPYGSAA